MTTLSNWMNKSINPYVSQLCECFIIMSVLFLDLLSELVSAGQTLPGPQDSVLRRWTVPLLRHDRGRQHRVPPHRILLQGRMGKKHIEDGLKAQGVRRGYVGFEMSKPSFKSFTPAGEELVPELQRVLHPDHATVHEAGIRQDAHRLQWVYFFFQCISVSSCLLLF